MVNLTKTMMFRARAVQYACLLCHLIKPGRCDDKSLVEKIGIKPHVQPVDLQGDLIY